MIQFSELIIKNLYYLRYPNTKKWLISSKTLNFSGKCNASVQDDVYFIESITKEWRVWDGNNDSWVVDTNVNISKVPFRVERILRLHNHMYILTDNYPAIFLEEGEVKKVYLK